jgi:hypothetical protein
MTFKERLKWAASLIATPRGIGWAHEPTDQNFPRPTASRRRFIASQFFWFIFYSILGDIALIPIRENPCFKIGGPPLAASEWWRRPVVWAAIYTIYFPISRVYAIYSIIFVATGLCEPSDWPHVFGSPLNAYTVRKSWGRVWHQLLRKIFNSHGNFLANALHLPKNKFTTYFKLFTAFFISGLLHAIAEYAFDHWQNFTEGPVATIQFFLLQAVGITFEDAIIAIASRLGYKESNAFKLIGFIWVFMWFTICIPIWSNFLPYYSGGVSRDSISITRFLKSFFESCGIFIMAT